jgi:endonuclease-8
MRMDFSGDLSLLTHMLMSGSWHIYRPGEAWQRRIVDMRIVIKTEQIWAVAFNVPIAEFHNADTLRRREGFRSLGQDVLAAEFNPDQSIESLRSRGNLEVGVALLTQSIMAGLGNVFKSEVCFACRINPFRRVDTLTTADLTCLVTTARKFLLANVTEASGNQMVTYTGMRRTTGSSNREETLWVYGRRNEPCRMCGTPIGSRKQGLDARTTFWCPQCQP